MWPGGLGCNISGMGYPQKPPLFGVNVPRTPHNFLDNQNLHTLALSGRWLCDVGITSRHFSAFTYLRAFLRCGTELARADYCQNAAGSRKGTTYRPSKTDYPCAGTGHSQTRNRLPLGRGRFHKAPTRVQLARHRSFSGRWAGQLPTGTAGHLSAVLWE